MSFVLHVIQSILVFLDKAVYGLASMVYELLINISESNIFTQDVIKDFSTNVYVLIGVFMMFKISLSLINYIVNPDDFASKDRGSSKLVLNIITTFIIIVFTPRIFAEAIDIQHLVTSQGVLQRIILGTEETSAENVGDTLSISLFNAFFYYDEVPDELMDAGLIAVDGDEEAYIYESYDYAFDSDGYNVFDGIWDDIAHYIPLASTAAGIVLILVLITFCFDVAVRTVKLGFLQLIAPIPIMSRIDPKSSKNGMFNRWLKACTKTYLDLFVRLGALYFAIALISMITENSMNIVSSGGMSFLLVKGMLILGVLMFAKQLPKFLEDILGIKLDGNFTLNPVKKLNQIPGTAAIGGLAGGMVGGFAANSLAAIKNNRGQGIKGFASGSASAIAGGLSGGFRGGYSGLTKNSKSMGKAMSAGAKGAIDARNLRDERELAGEKGIIESLKGTAGRTWNGIERKAGISSGISKYDNQVAAYDDYISKHKGVESFVQGEIEKGKAPRQVAFTYKDLNGVTKSDTGNVNSLKNEIEHLKNTGASANDITNAEYRYKAALKQATKDYISACYTNPTANNIDVHMADQLKNMISDMNYKISQNKSYDGFNSISISESNTAGDEFDSSKGVILGAKSNLTSSAEYRNAKLNSQKK